jgi:type IV secretory pathway VirB2 component (pilin)
MPTNHINEANIMQMLQAIFFSAKKLETPTMRANRVKLLVSQVAQFGKYATAMLSMLFLPVVAHAAPWESGASAVMDILQGPVVTTIAVCAVVFLGLAALFGKLEMKTAGGVIAGIVLIRGAPAIVDFFEGSATG